jgi:hypothetical protein
MSLLTKNLRSHSIFGVCAIAASEHPLLPNPIKISKRQMLKERKGQLRARHPRFEVGFLQTKMWKLQKKWRDAVGLNLLFFEIVIFRGFFGFEIVSWSFFEIIEVQGRSFFELNWNFLT